MINIIWSIILSVAFVIPIYLAFYGMKALSMTDDTHKTPVIPKQYDSKAKLEYYAVPVIIFIFFATFHFIF